MKKSFLLFLLVAGTVSAQKDQVAISEKSILGKWVFTDLIAGPDKPGAIPAKERKELMEGVYLDFHEDHTCVTGFILDLDGKWTLDVAAKKIIVTDRKTNTWTIHSLTANEIILSHNDSGETQKLVFKKT